MTLGAISALVSARLNEAFGAGGPKFYPSVEIVSAVNEGQRLFALLTLCIERTAGFVVAANTTHFHALAQLSDYIATLRLSNAAGTKIRPATFGELWALDTQWPVATGAPVRYVAAGADLISIYRQPATSTAKS